MLSTALALIADLGNRLKQAFSFRKFNYSPVGPHNRQIDGSKKSSGTIFIKRSEALAVDFKSYSLRGLPSQRESCWFINSNKLKSKIISIISYMPCLLEVKVMPGCKASLIDLVIIYLSQSV